MMFTLYFKENKTIFMSGLTALCVVMMIVSTLYQNGASAVRNAAGFVFVPVMSAFANTGGWVAGGFMFAANMFGMEAENARLRALNDELALRNSLLEFDAARIAELEMLLEMSLGSFGGFKTKGARIVTKEPGIWHGTPIINEGTNGGIRLNMPVVTTGGLYGRIIETGNTFSKIQTIIEDMSIIAAVSERTGNSGFIRGDYTLLLEGLVRFTFDSQNAEFAIGDVIVTSALSSFYPPGLVIGEIIEFRHSGGDRYAIVRPFADFRGARVVLVLMDDFDFVLQ
jgi:rod shape-determining protein MreC